MQHLTRSEIHDLLQKIVSLCFPGWDFSLRSRFAYYLDLSRDEVLKIFLKNRRKTDRELTQILSVTLEPGPIAQRLQKFPLDLQLCLLDRLLFAAWWLSLLKRYNDLTGSPDEARYQMPGLLIAVCTTLYLKEEVHRWLASNSLPSVLRLAPELIRDPENRA